MSIAETVEFNKETLKKMKQIISLNEMSLLISQLNNKLLRESWKWITEEKKEDVLKEHIAMHRECVEKRSEDANLSNSALITMLELAIKLRFPVSNWF